MRAGLLNEIIKVEQPVIAQNDYGANDYTEWETFIERTKAQVTYGSGNRVTENNEIFFTYEVIFTVRYYHKINEDMRIIWQNKKYRILSLQRNKPQQSLTIKTELINE